MLKHTPKWTFLALIAGVLCLAACGSTDSVGSSAELSPMIPILETTVPGEGATYAFSFCTPYEPPNGVVLSVMGYRDYNTNLENYWEGIQDYEFLIWFWNLRNDIETVFEIPNQPSMTGREALKTIALDFGAFYIATGCDEAEKYSDGSQDPSNCSDKRDIDSELIEGHGNHAIGVTLSSDFGNPETNEPVFLSLEYIPNSSFCINNLLP